MEGGVTGTPCTTWADTAEDSGCIGTHRARKDSMCAPPGRIYGLKVSTSDQIRYMYSTNRVHEIIQRRRSDRSDRQNIYRQYEDIIRKVGQDDTIGQKNL